MFTSTPSTSEVLFWKRAGCFLLVSATLVCIGCMQPSAPSRRKLVDKDSAIGKLMTKEFPDGDSTIWDLTKGIKEGTIVIDNFVKKACLEQAKEILSHKDAHAKLVKYAIKIRKFRYLIEALEGPTE